MRLPALLSLAFATLAACADVVEPILAPADTSAAECRGPATIDPTVANWFRIIRTYTWRSEYASADVILPPSTQPRWVFAAEITNFGSRDIRHPFLRVAESHDSGGGVVIVGDASGGAILRAGDAVMWADGAGIPIPPGWELNGFIPDLPAGAQFAYTVGVMECR